MFRFMRELQLHFTPSHCIVWCFTVLTGQTMILWVHTGCI